MIDHLFTTGRLFLVRKPIRGNYGPTRLFSLLSGGTFGIDITTNKEETYVIFTTRRRQMLLIFHIDAYGYDLTKRFLFATSRFRILLEDESTPLQLTREELRRLVIYGSCEEDFETLKRQNQELKCQLYAFQNKASAV